jgi:GTP cyclohydrolase I
MVIEYNIEYHIKQVLMECGEDPSRDGLKDTPKRVAKAYAELLAGYDQDPTEILKTFEAVDYGQMVCVKDVPFFSLCEHHMLPFKGVAHIGYVPKGRILGLSKVPRIVDVFARRLQVQERLTEEIADALNGEPLSPHGVMVVLEAEHLCMAMRGVKVSGSTTVTSAIRGCFRDPAERAREEFLSLIGRR